MVGGGKDREEMSRLIDIDNEKFWDILFDEACVEGNQAERIKNELEKIVAFDTEKVVEQLMIIHDEGYCPNEDGLECVLDKACSDCYREKIIDIVKKGGVE